MAKKVVATKKIKAPVQAEVPAPVVQAEAPAPIASASVAPTPSAAPVAAEPKKGGRKLKSQDTPDETKARWARRLARWQGKAEKAGVDARALMQAALAA
jgi:hypothetical protein